MKTNNPQPTDTKQQGQTALWNVEYSNITEVLHAQEFYTEETAKEFEAYVKASGAIHTRIFYSGAANE